MVAPTGGHPTLRDYLDFLRKNGYEYRTGYGVHHSVAYTVVAVLKLDSEEHHFRICDVDMDDILCDDRVAYYDRIFDVTSPFLRR